jgi:hypothetical protein
MGKAYAKIELGSTLFLAQAQIFREKISGRTLAQIWARSCEGGGRYFKNVKNTQHICPPWIQPICLLRLT